MNAISLNEVTPTRLSIAQHATKKMAQTDVFVCDFCRTLHVKAPFDKSNDINIMYLSNIMHLNSNRFLHCRFIRKCSCLFISELELM